MLNTVRSIANPPSSMLSSPLPSHLRRKPPLVRFRQAAAGTNQPQQRDKMEQTQEPSTTTGDLMQDSFGEVYATRSTDEGFGGTYRRNEEPSSQIEKDKVTGDNQHVCEIRQGSEVREKEKARHQ